MQPQQPQAPAPTPNPIPGPGASPMPPPQPERKFVQDIGPRPYAAPPQPAAPAAQPVQAPPPQQQVNTSIVNDIPVRQPAEYVAPTAPAPAAPVDDELDKILHDVDKEAKTTPPASPKKGVLSRLNILKKKPAPAPQVASPQVSPSSPQVQPHVRSLKPLVIIAAVVVTLVLIAAAVFAFRGGSNKPVASTGPAHKVTTSVAARGTITSTSLDQFNQSLQGDINSLSDNDFDTSSVSDQALGL
jgi:hypothetical protein